MGSGLQVEVAQNEAVGTSDTRVSLSYRVPLNADFSSAIPKPANTQVASAKKISSETPFAGKSYLYSQFIQENPGWVPVPGLTPFTAPIAAKNAPSLLDFTKGRPSFVPTHIDAIIDPTARPTRLVSIDKTVLPTGSTIDTATGITTIALPGVPGVLVSAINLTNGQNVL